ncbi:hypothetical protein CR152_19660 [Massilia violaceinigra]|uniref:UspA domain-containing protein n=1 Tax=Massilia violaceinigra TaxID=2045208 RepID=A0A2D2DVJ1_9BURK|nr:hypothetical protein CR152_19660 [Massilia violaceinigra]
MSYKTIVVHVDDIPNAGACYAFAAELARVEQAHLIGLASSGVSRFLRETVAMNCAAPSIAPYLDTMRDRAARALDQFERGAQLLVMGCYGHSRLRELLLGGATRTVLKSMTLPVLMAA